MLISKSDYHEHGARSEIEIGAHLIDSLTNGFACLSFQTAQPEASLRISWMWCVMGEVRLEKIMMLPLLLLLLFLNFAVLF